MSLIDLKGDDREILLDYAKGASPYPNAYSAFGATISEGVEALKEKASTAREKAIESPDDIMLRRKAAFITAVVRDFDFGALGDNTLRGRVIGCRLRTSFENFKGGVICGDSE